eukprot:GEZU01017653.1.p1 GENE.GEZU01017653.1~~GEZU01017653.1.p1  ORF type:complete len:127 (-),score=24.84 GEZU01017653.1:99-479(-)
MRTGDGFLIVFDLSSPKSLKEMQEFHNRILRVKDSDSVPMVIVGNKCDLPDATKPIKEAEVKGIIKQWAARSGYEVPYLEASALKRFMIEESFDTLVREIRRCKGATTSYHKDGKKKKMKKDCLIQ